MFSMNLAARDNVIAYSRAHFNVKSDFSSFPTQNDAIDVCVVVLETHIVSDYDFTELVTWKLKHDSLHFRLNHIFKNLYVCQFRKWSLKVHKFHQLGTVWHGGSAGRNILCQNVSCHHANKWKPLPFLHTKQKGVFLRQQVQRTYQKDRLLAPYLTLLNEHFLKLTEITIRELQIHKLR